MEPTAEPTPEPTVDFQAPTPVPTASPTPTASPAAHVAARPKLKVGPTTLRVSKKGEAVLRVTCTSCAPTLKLRVRLLHGRRAIATTTVAAGRASVLSVKLKLNAAARRTLADKGKLALVAEVGATHDGTTLRASAKVRASTAKR